jgi:Undecaprenyl-phosphate galactose phosphotransferase WbaP
MATKFDFNFQDQRASTPRLIDENSPNKPLSILSYLCQSKDTISLVGADILSLGFCIFIAFHMRTWLLPLFPQNIGLQNIYLLFWLPFLLALGFSLRSLYPGYGIPPAERISREFWTTIFVFLTLVLYEFLISGNSQARGVYLLSLALILLSRPLIFGLEIRLLKKLGLWGRPVVIIGASQIGQLVSTNLKQSPEVGLIPVGFLDDNAKFQGESFDSCPVIGGLAEAPTLARGGITYAIIARSDDPLPLLEKMLTQLPFRRIFIVTNMLDFATNNASIRDLGGLLTIQYDRNLQKYRNHFVKRVLDLAIAIPLFLFSLPVLIAAGLLIKMISPGPATYIQIRAGQGQKPIRVIKLRTMYVDAEDRLHKLLANNFTANQEWQKTFKLKTDPRIIKGLGHFLRRTSIDELPQLWNIIRGDMSLVGPRPFPLYHLSKFDPEFQHLRSSVKPGLTGYWQIIARSNSNLEIQRLLDRYYILNWSSCLDWYILVRTIFAVVNGRGAY